MRALKRLQQALNYLPLQQTAEVEQAYELAYQAHKGQRRVDGKPYITHPVHVATILAEMRMDQQTIIAALLHDVLEDTPITKQILSEKFGEIVAELVDGVSKLSQIEFKTRAEAQAEYFRKMVLAMAKDIRVILVKLADRLHNMRTLEHLRPKKRWRIARETLEIFAPIANRLGMHDLALELEDLGFSAQYPKRHRALNEAVRKARGNRKGILHDIEKTLYDGLARSSIPEFEFTGRQKHLYSIYRKMRDKSMTFAEIMDVYAFRIIVQNADECYRALGVVHRVYKPVPERFKDYIAIPKANGYQSLHTTLFGPYGVPIEIQIRTRAMDERATSGIAAHWLYKNHDEAIDKSQLRAQKWVKNLLEMQRSSGTSLEFVENVKIDLFPDEVYVFTPKGRIMELPSGATVIDFAYAVHTDVGNTCVAAKIDRQLAPLSTVLSNGQTVEIVTSQNARPNPAWLDFVVTGKARSTIRHFLKHQQHKESVSLGKQLLKQALKEQSLTLRKLSQTTIDALLKEAHFNSIEGLFEDIGLGNRMAVLVAHRAAELNHPLKKGELEQRDIKPLLIRGTEGMVVNFASCCCPLPGDPIIGVLHAGHGIKVHKETCKHIGKMRRKGGECIPVRWAEDVEGEFKTTVSVTLINQRGALAEIALAVSESQANIDDLIVVERDGQHFRVNFNLLVNSRKHLAQVMRNLRQVPSVMRLVRK